MKHGAIVGVLVLMAIGCSKKSEPAEPEFDPNDRALQKLMAEKDRLSKLPPPNMRPAEPDPLAEIAAAPSRPESLGIPRGVASEFGPIHLELKEVKQSQTIGNGKIALSTADRFVVVRLRATSTAEVTIDFAGATLESDERTFPIARDVQRLAGGQSTVVNFLPLATQDVVLAFELPDSSIHKGLKIVLTSPQSRVELPLQ